MMCQSYCQRMNFSWQTIPVMRGSRSEGYSHTWGNPRGEIPQRNLFINGRPDMKTSDAAVVDYFRQLAEAGDQRPSAAVLKEVASLFGATQLGLESLDAAAPDLAFSATPAAASPQYWRADVDLRAADTCLLDCACARATRRGNGLSVWLPNRAEKVAWSGLYRPAKTGWTDAEKVLWMFAAQALVRWLHQSGRVDTAVQQRRLEQAALITSRLSHDFGNYLTGIMGFTELSLSQAPPDSTLHRYLEEVLESARQGADWIRRLHGFCRRSRDVALAEPTGERADSRGNARSCARPGVLRHAAGKRSSPRTCRSWRSIPPRCRPPWPRSRRTPAKQPRTRGRSRSPPAPVELLTAADCQRSCSGERVRGHAWSCPSSMTVPASVPNSAPDCSARSSSAPRRVSAVLGFWSSTASSSAAGAACASKRAQAARAPAFGSACRLPRSMAPLW